MVEVINDKSQYCMPFILERFAIHQEAFPNTTPPPFFLGLNGVQGVGKTTLIRALAQTLRSSPYALPTVVLSIDDLYLPHNLQNELASSNSENPLVQHRGQPSTHDIPLGIRTFSSLQECHATKIPQYDKSRFNGQGDRVESDLWETVNGEGQEKVRVVIFEGWCVGFRSLGVKKVQERWEEACKKKAEGSYDGKLGWNRLEDIKFIDLALTEYSSLTNYLDALIHMLVTMTYLLRGAQLTQGSDAENTQYVYQWRLEQEAALRASHGNGMTEEQVVNFVNGYYPSYELYSDGLRAGKSLKASAANAGAQLQLIVGKDRKVKQTKRI